MEGRVVKKGGGREKLLNVSVSTVEGLSRSEARVVLTRHSLKPKWIKMNEERKGGGSIGIEPKSKR